MQALLRQLERAEIEGKAGRIAEIESDLAIPPFPEALGYLWRAYLRLRRRVSGGFSGPNPVGWQDIDAFIRRSGVGLVPWEIEVLERIDDLFVQGGDASQPPNAVRPMSEQLFDTLFS